MYIFLVEKTMQDTLHKRYKMSVKIAENSLKGLLWTRRLNTCVLGFLNILFYWIDHEVKFIKNKINKRQKCIIRFKNGFKVYHNVSIFAHLEIHRAGCSGVECNPDFKSNVSLDKLNIIYTCCNSLNSVYFLSWKNNAGYTS